VLSSLVKQLRGLAHQPKHGLRSSRKDGRRPAAGVAVPEVADLDVFPKKTKGLGKGCRPKRLATGLSRGDQSGERAAQQIELLDHAPRPGFWREEMERRSLIKASGNQGIETLNRKHHLGRDPTEIH